MSVKRLVKYIFCYVGECDSSFAHEAAHVLSHQETLVYLSVLYTRDLIYPPVYRFQVFLHFLTQNNADCSLEKGYITRDQILSCHQLMLHQGQENSPDLQDHNNSETGLSPIHQCFLSCIIIWHSLLKTKYKDELSPLGFLATKSCTTYKCN